MDDIQTSLISVISLYIYIHIHIYYIYICFSRKIRDFLGRLTGDRTIEPSTTTTHTERYPSKTLHHYPNSIAYHASQYDNGVFCGNYDASGSSTLLAHDGSTRAGLRKARTGPFFECCDSLPTGCHTPPSVSDLAFHDPTTPGTYATDYGDHASHHGSPTLRRRYFGGGCPSLAAA